MKLAASTNGVLLSLIFNPINEEFVLNKFAVMNISRKASYFT
jgi:hypothetical protein